MNKKYLIIVVVVVVLIGIGSYSLVKYVKSPAQESSDVVAEVVSTNTPATNQSGIKFYRNEKYGFEFEYPQDAVVRENLHSSGNSKFDLDVSYVIDKKYHRILELNLATPEFADNAFQNYTATTSIVVVGAVAGVRYDYMFEGSPDTSILLPLGADRVFLGMPEKDNEVSFNKIIASFKFLTVPASFNFSAFDVYKIWSDKDDTKNIPGYLPKAVSVSGAPVSIKESSKEVTPNYYPFLKKYYPKLFQIGTKTIRSSVVTDREEVVGAPVTQSVEIDVQQNNNDWTLCSSIKKSIQEKSPGEYSIYLYGDNIVTVGWAYARGRGAYVDMDVCNLKTPKDFSLDNGVSLFAQAERGSSSQEVIQANVDTEINKLNPDTEAFRLWLKELLAEKIKIVNAMIPPAIQ